MSKEVKTKEKVNLDPKYIIELTLKLFITCLVVAGLLGATNMVTKDKIAAINLAKTQEAMSNVVAEGSTFSDALEITADMEAAAASAGASVTEAYAVEYDGAAAGYVLKIVASGSQGSIEMMVGLDAEDVVTGVSIVKNAETAGIGSKVMENEPTTANPSMGVLDQFQGKSAADGTLSVGSNVDAITGATVSTKGVTTGVNAAIAVAGVMG